MQNFKTYSKFYNIIYANKDYKGEADWVYQMADQPQTIIDLGCGTGRHAKYWCKKAQVIGVDSSPEMLKLAYQHPNISYKCKDIMDFKTKGKVDCVTALFNVAGYIELDELLCGMKYLKKDGYFIFDCWDNEAVEKDPPKPTIFQSKNITKVVVPQFGDYQVVTFKNNKFVCQEDHKVREYSYEEIDNLCWNLGWKLVYTRKGTGYKRWYKLQKM